MLSIPWKTVAGIKGTKKITKKINNIAATLVSNFIAPNTLGRTVTTNNLTVPF